MNGSSNGDRGAGPVLRANTLGRAILEALEEQNPGVRVVDGGAYVRVSVPRACRLERAAVERITGMPFRLPRDLEAVMPAFEGRLSLDDHGATWSVDEA